MGNLTVINVVTDFGATGNGLADDTLAIQNALDAVPAGGLLGGIQPGAMVYFPQGSYLISTPLLRKQANTHLVGEGKNATTIRLNPAAWSKTTSPLDSTKSFMIDLGSKTFTDCSIRDMTLDGSARNLLEATNESALFCGIFAGLRDEFIRVNLYDIWGYGLWIFGGTGDYAKVIDCEAWLGANSNAGSYGPGNDCIGGGGERTVIQRFHWMPGMDKNTALDFQAGGGANAEVSVDIIDCINESAKHVALEGAVQSSIRGCRFYYNQLKVKTNPGGNNIVNPLDILVEGCIFIGPSSVNESGLVVNFDGGNYAPDVATVQGGRVAVIGNTFIDCDSSAIQWAGDDESTSLGGSIISSNRIYNPNQTGGQEAVVVEGIFAPLGTLFGSGISVLTTYGLTIQGNTIVDQSGDMLYSMQLSTPGTITDHNTARILVQGNLCGLAPGVGNGSAGTFYYISTSPTSDNPSPILLNNTNQEQGLDSSSVVASGTPWPGPGGYPYNAFICVDPNGANIQSIKIGGQPTDMVSGSFYVPVGQTFTVTWIGAINPIIKVFQS